MCSGDVAVYCTDPSRITEEGLEGFFLGWPERPSPRVLLRALSGSYRCVLALEPGLPRAIGFVYAVSDGVLSAQIPLLEVLPAYRGRGIGSELMRRLLADLEGLYMRDVTCDRDLVPFYERLGMRPLTAMAIRDPEALLGLRAE